MFTKIYFNGDARLLEELLEDIEGTQVIIPSEPMRDPYIFCKKKDTEFILELLNDSEYTIKF